MQQHVAAERLVHDESLLDRAVANTVHAVRSSVPVGRIVPSKLLKPTFAKDGSPVMTCEILPDGVRVVVTRRKWLIAVTVDAVYEVPDA